VEDNLLVEAVRRAVLRIEEKMGSNNIDALLHNLRNREGSQKMKMCIPSVKGFQVVKLSEIIYCEASSNYTNFHFTNRSVICASKPIQEYEALLDDCGFVRIHKSFMVNLEHIREYVRGEGGVVILSNGQDLEVSRRKKETFMTRMKDFYKY
jgi:two-component system LytT family response regulator